MSLFDDNLHDHFAQDLAWFKAHLERTYRMSEPTPGVLRLAECYRRGRTKMDLHSSSVAGSFNRHAAWAGLYGAGLAPEDAPEKWLAALSAYLSRWGKGGRPRKLFPQIVTNGAGFCEYLERVTPLARLWRNFGPI